MARGLVRSLAGGLTRLQVAAAEAWENLGDLWADARAEAQSEIEAERFAAEASAEEPAAASSATAVTAVATAATATAAAASRRRRGAGAAREGAKRVAKAASRPPARRSPRIKTAKAAAT
jgi:hypothetical protein